MVSRDSDQGGDAPVQPEFSRFFSLDLLNDGPVEVSVSATAKECAALAKRFDLVAIHRLNADLRIEDTGEDGVVRVSGTFSAAVTQTCSVSLDPFDSELGEPFEVDFASPAVIDRMERERAVESGHDEVTIEDFDLPEPLVGRRIDLGEVTAQSLAICLDPFPRAEGVALEIDGVDEESADFAAANPFAKLAALKNKH